MEGRQEKRERLAAILREYMRRENLSGRKLAQRLELSQPTVLAYLDGVTFPSEETRQRIATVLQMTLTELDAQLNASVVEPQFTLDLVKQEIRAMSPDDFSEIMRVVFDRALLERQTLT